MDVGFLLHSYVYQEIHVLEIFVISLIGLKWLGIINISWSMVTIISIALILVEIRIYQMKKSHIDSLLGVAKTADNKLDSFDFRLSQLERYSDYE